MILNYEKGLATFGTKDLYERELANFGNVVVPQRIDRAMSALFSKNLPELAGLLRDIQGAAKSGN